VYMCIMNVHYDEMIIYDFRQRAFLNGKFDEVMNMLSCVVALSIVEGRMLTTHSVPIWEYGGLESRTWKPKK
jgi:hypothetical protein